MFRFLMKFEGEESEICLDKHEQEFVEYAWWTFEQVLKEVCASLRLASCMRQHTFAYICSYGTQNACYLCCITI